MPTQPSDTGKIRFTTYQKFVIAILSFLQFTVILDFMILSPLGAVLIAKLDITPPSEAWMSWIDPKTPEADFHVPSSFGRLVIVE